MKKINRIKKASLITGALSLVIATSSPSYAKNNKKEKCAGLVKAGLSDCASVEHICAGMNSEDASETDWVWLPVGTCDKIKGAQVLKSIESEKTAKKG